MYSTWTKQFVRFSWILVLLAAAVALGPFGSAQNQSGTASSTTTVDDVLDEPQTYVGQDVTLEGEVDHIFSQTTFELEDDQDLIGDEGILVISVMPIGAVPSRCCPTDTTATNLLDPVPVVEVISLLEKEFKEGKLVSATGSVCMFDRAALEQQYGTIDFGSADLSKFENQPVVIIGSREYAACCAQPKVEQQVAVIPPPPPPPPPAPRVEPPPPPPPPAPEPPAPPAPEPVLPATATPLPAIALGGLLSLLVGLGVRTFRN